MRCLFLLIVSLLTGTVSAQPLLSDRLPAIAAEAQGKVYVACNIPNAHLACNLNPWGRPPMQSVFKLPLAMAVLHQVDLGKLKLDQPVRFPKSDRWPRTHSPMQDAHPNADVDIPLREVLRYTVSDSDNIGAEILLRLIGGPPAVQAYMDANFFSIQVHDGERGLSLNQKAQYDNWAEPSGMVNLLRVFADKSPLSASSTKFLDDLLQHSSTGMNRIRALLPKGTAVAHKTGTSDTVNGLTAATNDVGLITLPSGTRLALAIFVTDSRADQATRESVIARIAKAIYDDAVATEAHPFQIPKTGSQP